MDTLSRDSTTSGAGILPMAGLFAAGLALILAIVALVQLNKVKAAVAAQGEDVAKIATLESESRAALTKAEKSEGDLRNLRDAVQTALNQVGQEMVNLRGQVAKVEEAAKKPAPVATAKGGAAPAPTGVRNADGTYTIAAGDTLAKVATKFGVRLDAILAENPGIEPSRLRVGQKIRLPAGR